ncbi:MAG: DUF975 family protein [Prevotellaceae bacterium]|jgi:uncharacterized membrane protein|nr:DUF975 family protein [Prevotellaceae bacterium]
MVISNKNLMTQAREALSGRWGLAVGTYFVYGLILVVISSIPIVGFLTSLLVGGAFSLGVATFSLAFARREENAKLEMIFSGFDSFGKALGLYLLIAIFTLLWTLLLIIPGIIAAISYSQAFFIMSEDGSVKAIDAINKSQKMMYGYKWKYFCLGCRFIGWFFLGILSCGIGFLWIAPYLHISVAKFYEDVKANYVELA